MEIRIRKILTIATTTRATSEILILGYGNGDAVSVERPRPRLLSDFGGARSIEHIIQEDKNVKIVNFNDGIDRIFAEFNRGRN